MRLNNQAKAFYVIGIVVVVATIIIFSIANSEMNSHKWVGLFFLIFAELVFFIGGIGVEILAEKSSQIFTRIGNGFVLAGYSAAVFISAFLFLLITDWSIKSFWILQILLFTFTFTLEVIFGVTGKSIHQNNEITLNAVATVNEMVDNLTLLESNTSYKMQIEKLAEDLKYTDISTTVPVDDDIFKNISKLETEFLKDELNGKSIDEIIETISVLIKERKIQVKRTKGGSI